MAEQGVSGLAVAATAGGAVLVWSGIRGHRVSDTLRSVVSGQQPGPPDPALAITATFDPAAGTGTGTGSGTAGTTTTNSAIANDAQKYVGNRYVWGGAPGTTKGQDKGTDCSGFVNMVVGRDLGAAIPGYAGGKYDGSSHGPTTLQWIIYGKSVPGGASAAQAGDLLVWQTHMGISLGGGQMISALDTKDGVKITTVAGGSPGGEVLFVRRIT